MITVLVAYAKNLIGILNVSTIDADLPPAGTQSAVCASWAGCNRQLHPSIYISYPLMVFCLNCQHFWSRGFICQRPCSSVWCEEKIHTLVNILISHSSSTFLSLVMPKRLKGILRRCGGFVSNLQRTMPNSGKGESKAWGCGLANARSDGLQLSTKPYTYLE